jgi:hypothetical protein
LRQNVDMKESYLASVLRFAVKGFVFRTDAMQILLASLVPAYFQAKGVAMPEGTANIVLTYIAYGTITFMALRFVTAPYFIWKEQNETIDALQKVMDEPKRLSAKNQAEHLTKLKMSLADDVGKLKYLALIHGIGRNTGPKNSVSDFFAASNRASALVEQLPNSDDLAKRCREFICQCNIVFGDDRDNHINMDSRKIVSDLGQDIINELHSEN